LRCQTRKPDILLPIAIGKRDGSRDRGEARILRGETVVSGDEIGKEETTLASSGRLATIGAATVPMRHLPETLIGAPQSKSEVFIAKVQRAAGD